MGYPQRIQELYRATPSKPSLLVASVPYAVDCEGFRSKVSAYGSLAKV
jgi:hypothetical protein